MSQDATLDEDSDVIRKAGKRIAVSLSNRITLEKVNEQDGEKSPGEPE